MNTILPVVVAGVMLAQPAALPADSGPVVWIEAESYQVQRGSSAPSFAMPSAAGGSCVDNGWGGRTDDFLQFKFELTADFPTLYVTLRYAREPAGEAAVRVTLDGSRDQSAVIKLPSTGSWGFAAEGWRYAALQLCACAHGAHTLELRSLADENNVNFDGLYSPVA